MDADEYMAGLRRPVAEIHKRVYQAFGEIPGGAKCIEGFIRELLDAGILLLPSRDQVMYFPRQDVI